MIREKEPRGGRPVIDLSGPDGNAFALLGMAKRWCDDLNRARGGVGVLLDWKAIQAEATSGDYEHLLSTLEEHFGDYVTFER